MTEPTERPFRFAVNMTYPAPGAKWAEKCRAAEVMGYDVIDVPDHLVAPDPRVARDHPATPSPFPGLVLAASATEQARAGTMVLNTAFYNPLLLARDVATTATLLEGRLELGLGTGYDRTEVETAGLPWKTPGERIAHLESVVDTIRAAVEEAGAPAPPLLIGARGQRMLRYAAAEADIIGFTGIEKAEDGVTLRIADHDEVGRHVTTAREALGPRIADVELNLQIAKLMITDDRESAVTEFAAMLDLDFERVAGAPSLLIGSVAEIAQQIRYNRKEFGFSYLTVIEADHQEFAKVMEHLRLNA
jgi:probable F420-dependent oxidoreductase